MAWLLLLPAALSAACRHDANGGMSAPSVSSTATSTTLPSTSAVPPTDESLKLLELSSDQFAPYAGGPAGRYPQQEEPTASTLLWEMHQLGWVGGNIQRFGDETSRGMLSVHLVRGTPNADEVARAAASTLETGLLLDEVFQNVKVGDNPLGDHRACIEFRSELDGVTYHTYTCYLISLNVVAYLTLIVGFEETEGLSTASQILAAVAERVKAAAVPAETAAP